MPTASSSSRRLRRRRRRLRRRRDWAGLPVDVILSVLGKLDHVDVLVGAGQVCRSWRRAARDEPTLYRRIDICGDLLDHYLDDETDIYDDLDLTEVARAAVRRATGQCEAFQGDIPGNDSFLHFLADEAPSLKSLRLHMCDDASSEGFAEAIRKLPLLEDLELSLCSNLFGKELFQTVGHSCPRLKHFARWHFHSDPRHIGDRDEEAAGIATMTELRSLKIHGNLLTNNGLVTILDSCPNLESLDIDGCNINMDDVLREKCANIQMLMLPEDHLSRSLKFLKSRRQKHEGRLL